LEDEVMSACEDGHTTQPCPGCGTCIHWLTNIPVRDETPHWVEHDWRIEHTSERCHAADPVRRAARELADELVSLTNGTLPVVLGRKLAALRAALETTNG
jgi:hypothetical protein